MVKRTLRVSAWDDGFPLAVSVFTPESDIYDSEKVVVLINGATGCFQYYYAAFATWLTKNRIAAVTWDYRYTGDSLPLDVQLPVSDEARLEIIKSPEASKITLTRYWGMKDQPAVVEFTLNHFKGYKLVVIGHSLGGHLMPLIPEKLRSQIYRPIFLAANNPNYQFVPADYLPTFLDIWTNTLKAAENEGYLPKSASYFGVALPAGAAIEWARSMLSENHRYFAAQPELVSFYMSWNPKNGLVSLVFADDVTNFGLDDKLPVDGWCDVLSSATITRVLVSPEEYGMKQVGHIGMFKRENEKAWELMRDLAVDGKLPTGKVRRWGQGKVKL